MAYGITCVQTTSHTDQLASFVQLITLNPPILVRSLLNITCERNAYILCKNNFWTFWHNCNNDSNHKDNCIEPIVAKTECNNSQCHCGHDSNSSDWITKFGLIHYAKKRNKWFTYLSEQNGQFPEQLESRQLQFQKPCGQYDLYNQLPLNSINKSVLICALDNKQQTYKSRIASVNDNPCCFSSNTVCCEEGTKKN